MTELGNVNFMTHKPIYALFMTSGQIYATAFFTTALFGGIGVGLAVFGGLVSNIRLSYKIDEAFDKRNQLKLQIEEINRQCTKVNGVSRRVDTYTILLQVPVIWRLLLLRKTFTSWT